jgi:hypothetical protein
MARKIRIALLLLVLAIVAGNAWLDRHITTSWQHTVWVGLFPVNADRSAAAQAYIESLRPDDFAAVAALVNREAHRYGVGIDEPVHVQAFAPLARPPPALSATAGSLGRALWSLRLRWYRWNAVRHAAGPAPQIALFLLYHDPARAAVLPHSLGLQKGLMGVAHVFAFGPQEAQNEVVVAHELLHIFGASDKYSPDDDMPVFPDGYAEPDLKPLLPQHRAELMAGRTPLAADRAEMPASLVEVVVGPLSAREIGWLKAP